MSEYLNPLRSLMKGQAAQISSSSSKCSSDSCTEALSSGDTSLVLTLMFLLASTDAKSPISVTHSRTLNDFNLGMDCTNRISAIEQRRSVRFSTDGRLDSI